jgi:manganese transport protein
VTVSAAPGLFCKPFAKRLTSQPTGATFPANNSHLQNQAAGPVATLVDSQPRPPAHKATELTADTPADGTAGGWRRKRGTPSLQEVFGSVRIQPKGPMWRKLLAFLGPGYLVAVGYMDPGNWATSLAGGSKFGYALLTVALLSNIMAIVLQALCARLGIGAGRDLAQACRDAFPRWVSYPLWALAEIAICATDLAEVIGTAIGLNLLFGIPLEIGVILTALDVLLILWMQNLGFRWVEAFVVTLLGVITICFGIQIAMADPDWGGVIRGFAPTTNIVTNPNMLYLALGILGATVMPHNLYLHSGVVLTRRFGDSAEEKREAIKLATLDSTIALMFALFINASILILAAATFNKVGKTDVAELDQVHSFLAPLLGSALAPSLFAIALLCCGLNSTVTATLSGQIVMEGFLDIRLPPWLRRLTTRAIAIVPAAIVTIWYGERGTAQLLILSQVILSLQLSFAVVPLVMFTADRRKMGELIAPRWLSAVAVLIAAIIIVLNVKLLVDHVM